MNMIEKVAKAMFEAREQEIRNINPGRLRQITWEEHKNKVLGDPRYGDLYTEVKAALKAMREPTRAMVNAAWIGDDSPNGTLVREFSTIHARERDDLSDDTAYEVWQAMIDAALRFD